MIGLIDKWIGDVAIGKQGDAHLKSFPYNAGSNPAIPSSLINRVT